MTFALPAESSGFLRRLRKKSRSDQSGIRIIRGEIDDRKIKVLYTGVGETICRQRMAALLRGRQFKYLISAGFAGALSDRQCLLACINALAKYVLVDQNNQVVPQYVSCSGSEAEAKPDNGHSEWEDGNVPHTGFTTAWTPNRITPGSFGGVPGAPGPALAPGWL